MSKVNKKILLIDGNALIHRAFHALPALTTKAGELVNAVFGFTSVLLKAIKELKPTHVLVAFDKKGPTFRHKIFIDYKATRQAAPQELYKQIPRIKQVIQAFNIPSFEIRGYEADDIIGTLSKKIGFENIIVTGDLDALQLVDENTRVYTLRRGVQDTIIYDERAVFERYRLTPKQLIDFKALRGDPSDNIPGVRGIGEKTATYLLQKFKNLENLYKRIEEPGFKQKNKKEKIIKENVLFALLEHKKEAFLSKRLAKIICDIRLDFDLEKCKLKEYDREKVVRLFQELEFRSLLARLPESKKAGQQAGLFKEKIKNEKQKEKENQSLVRMKDYRKYILVDSEEKFNYLIKKLSSLSQFALDTETTSQHAMEARLLGISFAWKENEAYYVPIYASRFSISAGQFSRLKAILENKKIKKIGHNIKYDLIVLKNSFIDLRGIDFDTMVASYVLAPGTRRHNLEDLAFQELGYEMMSFDDLVGQGKNKKKIEEIDLERLAFYSCEDVDFTFRLFKIFQKKLAKEKMLERIFKEIEMPLISCLAQMEMWGVRLDKQFLKDLSKIFETNIKELEKEIYKLAGCKFNVNSSKQLKEILFKKLKISTREVKKIQTGFSTAASELAKLRLAHPIISLIEKHRELAKLKNTYTDALPRLVNIKTGRVHTSFNQTVTATGRLSSSDPNLQNIPVKTEIGRQIRRAFIAEKGYYILSCDYSQIELRVMAHLSQDQNLIKAFERDEDIHAATAATLFKKEAGKISFEERRVAKTINFAVMYGMSPYGLAQTLTCDVEEAKEFINKYFENYPSIALYIKKTLDFARKNGYVKTLMGRRRYLPELVHSQGIATAAAERMAINAPIQGLAADIIKIAMQKILPLLSQETKMIIQVHDELVFEIKKEQVKKVAKEIKKIMENAFKLCIPLKVDVSYGENWGDLKKLSV